MMPTVCRSSLLGSNGNIRQQHQVHCAAPTHLSVVLYPGGVSTGRPSRFRPARAADPGDNGVPALDDAEAAPIPLVPAPAQNSSPGPFLAVGAVVIGAAVFFATRLSTGGVSFDTLSSDAMPLSTALANHRPSVIEFYASWCVLCVFLFIASTRVSHLTIRRSTASMSSSSGRWGPRNAG